MVEYVFKDNSVIGNLEAETDVFLENCFIETSAYNILCNYDESDPEFFKRIIVGRTGSGKTALLRKITESARISKSEVIEAEKTIFEHIKNNRFISKLTEHDIDLRIFFKSLWVHVILVKIIEMDGDKVGILDRLRLSTEKIKHKEKIQEYFELYSEKFFDDEALVEITSDFEKNIQAKIEIPSTGEISGGLGEVKRKKIQSETNHYVNQSLLQGQKSIVGYLAQHLSQDKQKKVVVHIDDLDKSWFENTNVHYDFIGALLEAFKELLRISTVKVLISIRTDILEGVYENRLKQDEKDLSLILPVEWSQEGIQDLLDVRINHLLKNKYAKKQNPYFKDVFDAEVNGVPADEFILERTMLRPRDAIDFVNICFNKAQGNTVISEDNIIEAEESYYVSRKQALAKEWGGLYPEIANYLDALSFVKKRTFDFKALKKQKSLIEEHLINNSKFDEQSEIIQNFLKDKTEKSSDQALSKLLELWFRVGVIGIHKSPKIIIYSNFQKRKLDITDFNKTFIIHPLFWRN